jgi:hypothetical protein
MSLKHARGRDADAPITVMMHYPPLTDDQTGFSDLLEAYGVADCVYGHLHGAAIYGAAVSAPAISAEDFDSVAPVEVGERRFSPEAFDRVVVNAFQALDTGVLAAGSGAFVLENKFFVLTSAGYRESGWSVKNKYSFFTKWLTDAVKTKGRMPADADRNRITTLNELFNRIKKAAAKKVIKYEGVKYKQHVQVYPGNSGFELFFR